MNCSIGQYLSIRNRQVGGGRYCREGQEENGARPPRDTEDGHDGAHGAQQAGRVRDQRQQPLQQGRLERHTQVRRRRIIQR